MKNLNKRAKFVINRYLVLGVILLAIGTLLDLQISKLLYLRTNLYPSFIRLAGEMPLMILSGGLCLNLIFRYIKLLKEKNYEDLNFPQFILVILAFILPTLISSMGIPGYFENTSAYLWLFIFIFYIGSSFLTKSFYDGIDTESLEKFFTFMVIGLIFSMLLVNLLKNLWSRSRFFHMYEKNDFSQYSTWLIPQFRKTSLDIYKSFPSGHTTSATLILAWLYAPQGLKNKNYYKYLENFVKAWPLLVALGRILDGAHYLTDVSFAIIMTCLLIKISHHLVYEKSKAH